MAALRLGKQRRRCCNRCNRSSRFRLLHPVLSRQEGSTAAVCCGSVPAPACKGARVFFDNTLLSTLVAHALSHPVKGSWTHGCAAQDGGGQQSAFDTAISQPCHAWSAHTGGDCSLARTSCTHLVTPAWVPFKGAGALTGAGSAGLVASLTPFPEKPRPLFPALRYIMLVLTASLLRLYSGCLGVNIAQHLKA